VRSGGAATLSAADVTLSTPAVTLPASCVTVPASGVTLSAPGVVLLAADVTLSRLGVTLSAPDVTLSGPRVTVSVWPCPSAAAGATAPSPGAGGRFAGCVVRSLASDNGVGSSGNADLTADVIPDTCDTCGSACGGSVTRDAITEASSIPAPRDAMSGKEPASRFAAAALLDVATAGNGSTEAPDS
jgi:hypothetical protein